MYKLSNKYLTNYYMISSKKINDITIKPVKTDVPVNTKPIKGADMFNKITPSNVLLVASTHSGKTTTLFNILKNTVDDRCNVWIFASTIDVDPTWISIVKMLLKKGCKVHQYESFLHNGVSILPEILNMMPMEDSDKEEESDEVDPVSIALKALNKKPKKKKKIYKTIVPRNVMVFDDLSSDLRDPSMMILSKVRHYARVFISCHDPVNILPAVLRQITYFIMFKGLSKKRVIELAEKAELTSDRDEKEPFLLKLYEHCTKEKYNFLFIDKLDNEYRCNFNKKLIF